MRFLWKSQIERGKKTSPRPEKKKRRSGNRRKYLSSALLVILWLLLLCTLGYALLFSPFLLVDSESVRVGGTNRLSAASLEDFVRTNISGKRLGIFPKSNFLLIRPDTLEEEILLRFPLARFAEVTRSFPHSLEIEVKEREKIILWCSGGPCYLITESGMAAESRQALGEENREWVRTVIDTSAQPVRLGQKLFSFDLPGFVSELERLLTEQLDVRIEPPHEAVSRFAGELRFKTSEGYRLYVSTEREPGKTAAGLRLLFEKELPEERRRALEYIDARTENRMYYLMKANEEAPREVPSAEEKAEKKGR